MPAGGQASRGKLEGALAGWEPRGWGVAAWFQAPEFPQGPGSGSVYLFSDLGPSAGRVCGPDEVGLPLGWPRK